jgi:N,N'-diacetyllegionaminate synthase
MTRPNTFVIAEAGVNHNGSLVRALELVSAAKACGADAVKFQTFSADRLVTRSARKAAYQRAALPGDDSQHAMLRSLELGLDDFRRIRDHAAEVGIGFLSSPFDAEAIDALDALGVGTFKVPSGEITNLPYLRHLGSKGKPVILSTGMSWLVEVETAVRTLQEAGAGDLTLLHCVSEYPAPVEQINLRAMRTLADAFGLPVGYSDHTTGSEIALAAVALGASVIEKHFTLDTTLPGPDHRASLDPPSFAAMVAAIRNVERALGDGRKRPADCEVANLTVVRKSIVAARDLAAGTLLEAADLAAKRPASGIPPTAWDDVLGRILTRDVEADEALRWEDLA